MYKIIQAYYDSKPGDLSFPSFHSFIKKSKDLFTKLDIEQRFFDKEEFLFVTSEYATGTFKTLLEDKKQDFFIHEKQAICFELENIKDNMDVLPLTFMMIRDVIDTVVFKNQLDYKRIFMEELAKLIEYPAMRPVIKFYLQTCRKHDAGLTYVLQTLDQIPEDDFGNQLLTNTQVFHILEQERGIESLKRRLNLSNHSMNQILSIQNDLRGNIKYTEDFFLLGNKGNVLRIELSAEEREAYKSEKRDKVNIYRDYEKNGNMEQAIINNLK
jgi:type IV secretory pathway VirB4 component